MSSNNGVDDWQESSSPISLTSHSARSSLLLSTSEPRSQAARVNLTDRQRCEPAWCHVVQTPELDVAEGLTGSDNRHLTSE
jgi:hypothetical protein